PHRRFVARRRAHRALARTVLAVAASRASEQRGLLVPGPPEAPKVGKAAKPRRARAAAAGPRGLTAVPPPVPSGWAAVSDAAANSRRRPNRARVRGATAGPEADRRAPSTAAA